MNLENRNVLSVLNAHSGYSNVAVSISNYYQLIRTFGMPQEENYKSWFMIYNYLKYQTPIDVIRPISVLAENKSLDLFTSLIPTPNTISNFYNSTVADISTITDNTQSFTIVEKYINSNEDIAVVFCDNITSWKNSITNEFVDIVLSRSITDPSTLTPEDQDTYIVPSGAIGDWIGQINNLAIYDSDTSTWNFVTTSEGASYYIIDEKVEVVKTNEAYVDRFGTYTYIEYDIHTYIRDIYTTIQNDDGEIKKFYQLMNITPDFDNGEIAIFIFKKNSLNTFDLVEKHIVNIELETADNYYTTLNETSNYIYIKYFSGSVNTTSYSIIDNTFVFADGTPIDYINVSTGDIEDCVDTIDFDDYSMVLNIEFDSSMDYIPTKCIDTTCLCLTGIWDSYSTVSDLINDFGIYAETPTGYTIFNRNNLIVGNYVKIYDRYNDKNRIVPLCGDIAGYILSDKKINLENTISIPTLYGAEDVVLLKENKINIVEYDSSYKNYLTSEKFVNKFKYGYNVLIHNKIVKTISEIINNSDNTYMPPFERYKDRMYYQISTYLDGLVDFDIDGYELSITLNKTIINIDVSISYYTTIESIVVNFTGYLNETMTLNYKE